MNPKPIVAKETFGEDWVREPVCPTCGSDDIIAHIEGSLKNVWFECRDCGQKSDTGENT